MLFLLQSGKIRFYVPYTVIADLYYLNKVEFNEIKRFMETHNFVNMYSVSQGHEILGPLKGTLMWRYSKPMPPEIIEKFQRWNKDKGINLNLHRPVFELAENGRPSKYARNIAESVVAGLPFITINDRVYQRCYREEMIIFAGKNLLGVSKKARPISPVRMLQNYYKGNRPYISQIYADALKESNLNLKKFDFTPIEEQEMNL